MRIRAFILFFLLLLSSNPVQAQDNQDLIFFNSEFEKQVLTNPDDHTDLDFLMAITPGMEKSIVERVSRRIDEFRTLFEEKKFTSKSEEKK